MSLTRGMLKGMGLTDEQVSAIIDEHVAVVDGLKAERDKYKEEAKTLSSVQKELDDLKSGNDDWKGKYEKEHKAFEDFKKDVTEKEKSANIKAAYTALLKASNVGEKHIASILKVTDFSKMELGEDGKLADEAKLIEGIKADWEGFIETTSTKGAKVEEPPASNNNNHVSKDEIYKRDERGKFVHSTSERQQMLADNMANE